MRKVLIVAAALTFVVPAGAIPNAEVIARDSTTSSFATAFGGTDLRFDDGFNIIPQPYSAFGFQVKAPARQALILEWRIACHKGSNSRDTSGKRKLRGRGVTRPITFWRAPSLAQADACNVSFSASRDFDSKGRMIVTILGR